MTKKRTQEIVNEVVKPDERVTSRELIERLSRKAEIQTNWRAARPYVKVMDKCTKADLKARKVQNAKRKQIKAFNKAVDQFVKADEKEQKRLLKAVLSQIEQAEGQHYPAMAMQDVFPEFGSVTSTIQFTDEETRRFSEPFKTLFDALDNIARVTKKANDRGDYTYQIQFRRYGYKVSASDTDLKEAKRKFIEAAGRADE